MPEHKLSAMTGGRPSRLAAPASPASGEGTRCPFQGLSDASRLLMRVCASTYSAWFVAMRSCIGRERERQRAFREENGLPKAARIPYERQPLTTEELITSSMAESLVRTTFGDGPADYAKRKFTHALNTGDMRSFKIRLLLLKARDSMAGSLIQAEFSSALEECIALAESMAGCKPDPTPRKMSRAEKERKRVRDMRAAELQKMQPDLPGWTYNNKGIIVSAPYGISHAYDQNDASEDQEHNTNQGTATGKDPVELPSGRHPSGRAISRYCKNAKNAISISSAKSPANPKESGNRPNRCSVTVTRTVTHDKSKFNILRKVREYSSVEQILNDIENGAIDPYESEEEICNDLRDGKISAVEAFMFIAALEVYSPSERTIDEVLSSGDLDRDFADDDGEGDEDGDDAVMDEDDGPRGGAAFSYNPRGFAGTDEWYGEDN